MRFRDGIQADGGQLLLVDPEQQPAGSPDEGPLIGNVRPSLAPPGRGRLVTRDRGVEVVQLAWRDPSL